MKMRWKVNLDFLLFFAYAIAFVDFASSLVKPVVPRFKLLCRTLLLRGGYGRPINDIKLYLAWSDS